MSKIRIATDSTADIPESLCEELNISVLPLTILSGEKEYRDGVDISPAEFYRIIDESEKLPVSSQVASVLYSDLFEETWKAGYTDLIQVTLNSKGSGTYQAAVLSMNLFYEEHPEAKEQLAIHIIDSKTYSITDNKADCFNIEAVCSLYDGNGDKVKSRTLPRQKRTACPAQREGRGATMSGSPFGIRWASCGRRRRTSYKSRPC